MPYSSFIFDDAIAQVIKLVNPKVFLDLGAGAGKYGSIVRKIDHSINIIAIEIEKDYLERFNLHSIYDEIWNVPIINLMLPEYYNIHFDVVMAGDVLEHLKKSEGIDILNFLIYRSRWIIVEFPHRYLQNAVDGYTSEAHISVWTEDDFSAFEKTQMYMKDTQHLIILRGYLEDNASIKQIERILQKYAK